MIERSTTTTLIRGHRPGLYIGTHGDVVCAEDAPSGDTWEWGRYIRFTPLFEARWLAESSIPRCEICGMGRKEANDAR